MTSIRRPAKALELRRNLPHGALVGVELAAQFWVFGQYCPSGDLALFDYWAASLPTKIEDIPRAKVAFRVAVSLYGLRRRRWVNFGVAPLAPPLDKAQKTARRPIGSKSIYLDDFANFSVNDSVVISPARARNLEKSAVYSLCHVEVRLMEFFSGNEAARLSTVFADYGWGATEVEIVALEARMLRHVNNMSARKQ